MIDHSHVVAIDGPGAAGKSTVARMLADRLGAMLFDTGTLYRALTLEALREGVSPANGPALAKLAESRHLDIVPPSSRDGRLYDVLLDGEDVTWAIRDPRVEAAVSEVSAHPEVRQALLAPQRRIASGRVVIVGRDIGSVVVPDAGVKVFLQASLAERARRRLLELTGRGVAATLDDVRRDLARRDEIDSNRSASPLRIPSGAIVVDTDSMDIGDVVDLLERLVRERWRDQAPVTGAPPTRAMR
ncbi:MAG TPA: (d)CMP kinase [Thermomicrobiales bacterium]|nr:(d)CMP kinase [Thermomicrobiales bacterium]